MNFIFDFDSTLITIESLDYVLSKISGGKFDKQIEEITNLGMDGKIDLKTSITKRLEICGITKNGLENAALQMKEYITPGITEIIENLHDNGHKVYIVSGGITQLILPVANKLNIPPENCFANTIFFEKDGSFAGLDLESPLLYKNGKSKALEHFSILDNDTVMIGDGYTDLEVHIHNQSIKFIGFGVNIKRDSVKDKSPIFVNTMNEFKREIEKLTS